MKFFISYFVNWMVPFYHNLQLQKCHHDIAVFDIQYILPKKKEPAFEK